MCMHACVCVCVCSNVFHTHTCSRTQFEPEVVSPRERVAREGPEYRGGRSTYDPSKVGVKTSLPTEVLAKKEEGIDGDFRKKLHKAEDAKIDTTKAFPQAQTKGEQVDFRNVLRKSAGPERKVIKTGAAAQNDFRGSLKRPKKVSHVTMYKFHVMSDSWHQMCYPMDSNAICTVINFC